MRSDNIPFRPITLVLLLAGTGAAVASAAFASAAAAPARCELRVVRDGDGVALTALAHAGAPVSGRYAFSVTGPGTAIRQGGAFSAAPGRPATLGTMRLGAAQLGARAALDLTVDGRVLSCRSGGAGGI